MAVLRITEAELARDLHAVLEKVQMGTEVIIEQNSHPVAVLRAPEPCRRKLSEIVASPSEHSTATLDPDFAADVQEFIDSHRETLNTPELAEPAGSWMNPSRPQCAVGDVRAAQRPFVGWLDD